MRSRTPQRSSQERVYLQLNRIYLERHPDCESPWPCGQASDQVHHMAGREGWRLLDMERWLALCAHCHRFATEHPREAIEAGVSLPRVAS